MQATKSMLGYWLEAVVLKEPGDKGEKAYFSHRTLYSDKQPVVRVKLQHYHPLHGHFFLTNSSSLSENEGYCERVSSQAIRGCYCRFWRRTYVIIAMHWTLCDYTNIHKHCKIWSCFERSRVLKCQNCGFFLMDKYVICLWSYTNTDSNILTKICLRASESHTKFPCQHLNHLIIKTLLT